MMFLGHLPTYPTALVTARGIGRRETPPKVDILSGAAEQCADTRTDSRSQER
jgi:hypothetical protein